MNPSGMNDCRVLCVFVTSLAVTKHQDQGNCWEEGFVQLCVPLWPNGHVVASAGKLRAHILNHKQEAERDQEECMLSGTCFLQQGHMS